jgi:hypothetical protein
LVLTCLPLFWGCVASSEGTATQRTLSGEVRDAQSGRGIAGAMVKLSSDALDRAETSTDDDGHFSLSLEVSDGVLFGHVSASHRDYERAAAASVYLDGADNVIEIELRHKPTK